MKKQFTLFGIILSLSLSSEAKIWRVNNNAGVAADATTLVALFNGINTGADPEAANGDTIHVEPSTTTYAFPTINKQVVIIGNGYLLSGATGNAGLQENTNPSSVGGFRFASGSAGTKIIGITLTAGQDFAAGYSGNVDITFEKCRFTNNPLFSFATGVTYTNIAIRKCLIAGINNTVPATTTLNNFILENCIMFGNVFYFQPTLANNFMVRNCTFSLNDVRLQNAYVANNIIRSLSGNTFIACNVKNNIFTFNQTGVVVGPLSTNGNNLVNQAIGSIILNTGSDDGQFQLAAGSPAINGGVDIGGQKPNCGAFGGNDPYKLSGIPGIPTIYSLTVPTLVPLGSPTMNVTFSTRNNN